MTEHPTADARPIETFEDQVRRSDPDRWLASRFIGDPGARAVVVAIYALDGELARIKAAVAQPLAGEIRLAWWRERVEAIAGGKPAPAQPVLQALAAPIAQGRLQMDALQAMIEARHLELEARPFADDAALARYLDGISGALMALAARALDATAPPRCVVEAGRAWGLAGLLRDLQDWRAKGRSWVPMAWGPLGDAELVARVASEVDHALAVTRTEAAALPVAAFPAVAYATLARPYARGHTLGQLERRGRLLKAVLTGRL